MRLDRFVGLCVMLSTGTFVIGVWFQISFLRNIGLLVTDFFLIMLVFCTAIILLIGKEKKRDRD